jgi:hypothetical protein
MTVRYFQPQMTSAEFSAALREAGFGVKRGQIVDISGRCPGFAAMPTFRNGAVNRNGTLAKVIKARDAEIERRAGAAGPEAASVPPPWPPLPHECRDERHLFAD